MKLNENIKRFGDDYLMREQIKSVVTGIIFFVLIASLIIVLTVNIAFLYIAYLTQLIIMADLLISFTGYFAVKVVYFTLLNYNSEPTTDLLYIRKIDLIVTPIVVFLLGLITLLFI